MERGSMMGLVRLPFSMRTGSRSGFEGIFVLAIGLPAPCIDAKTQFLLRTAEPENYTNGSVQDRGIHIVTQQSAIRAEIPLLCPANGRFRRGVSPRACRGWQDPKMA